MFTDFQNLKAELGHSASDAIVTTCTFFNSNILNVFKSFQSRDTF